MKIISFDDIKGLELSPLTRIEWVDAALRNKADAQPPSKTSIRPSHTQDGTFVNTMPCFVGFEGRGALRSYRVTPAGYLRFPRRFSSMTP